MAEASLRHELEERACDGVQVESAGTWAATGEPATDEAILICEAKGIDLSSHRSRALEAEDIDAADVVVGMTSVHIQEIASLVPEARSKTMLLKEMAETEMPPLWPEASPEERLQGLLMGSRPRWRRKLDVADPIGRPLRIYERCFSELQSPVRILADILCPDEVPP
ncbi:MAG: protein arginine phosphatase [Actinomycetota bacterium]|jgi:protein-tyrosine-phosphatase|nr:protein arginine phosphatase [Actinomycetota bacterium]